MSMLQAIRDYMDTFPELKDNVFLFGDHQEGEEPQYSIQQLPGTKVLESFLDGTDDCQYTFAFQSAESTADELERYANAEFFEKLDTWFKAQTLAQIFPTLETGQVAERIETTNWSYLMAENSLTGVYQIQCLLLYSQS